MRSVLIPFLFLLAISNSAQGQFFAGGDGSTDNPMTVLASDCKLRGISKLRVVDASVMPTITSGNTNAPVMFIAENVSKKMLRKN